MTEKSYQDAVQVLRDHIGGQWEGGEIEGRNEMVKALRTELGYDRKAANNAIDAMIKDRPTPLSFPCCAERCLSQ
jgi:hypothetical protein